MNDIGLTPPEQARVQQAADEAFRVLTGEEEKAVSLQERCIEVMRRTTERAPLRSLAAAFLLGAWIARRR